MPLWLCWKVAGAYIATGLDAGCELGYLPKLWYLKKFNPNSGRKEGTGREQEVN